MHPKAFCSGTGPGYIPQLLRYISVLETEIGSVVFLSRTGDGQAFISQFSDVTLLFCQSFANCDLSVFCIYS